MENILIFIKHHFSFVWRIIEWNNELIFSLLFKSSLEKELPVVFNDFSLPPFLFRKLTNKDAEALFNLICEQEPHDLDYFHPHAFSLDAIRKQFGKKSFLMMGVFDGGKMNGYFFLRFFANKKCFVGRLIDRKYRGKGIGDVMNMIMYETAWRMKFRCLSTISRKNLMVMQAHSRNRFMKVSRELQNDYLLVEFISDRMRPEK